MTFANLMQFKNSKTINNGDTKFQIELSRLNKEAKTEMRMHDTEKQRFRKKYSKLDIYNDNPITEASEIRMYETHIPGFCYKSNGECRCPPVVMPNVFVDFQDMHALIFTNGEVDMEKVLYLHMLCYHKIDMLTPPPKRYNFFLPKKMLPIERLIERSKKKMITERFIKNLQTYVIDTQQPKDRRMDDLQIIEPRLQSKILINEKLMELVYTVLTALKQSNIHKFRNVLKVAKNERFMKDLLTSAKMEQFTLFLKGLQLVTSCEAFTLTTPHKKPKPLREITIKTDKGQVEDLLKYIRRNIFQIPEALNVNSSDNKETIMENNLETLSTDNLSLEYEIFSQNLEQQNNEEYGLDINESLEKFCCEDETIINRPFEMRINRRDKRTSIFINDEAQFKKNKTSLVDSLTLLNIPEVSNKILDYNAKDVEESEIGDDTDLVQVAQTLNKKVKELATRDKKSQNIFYFDDDEPKKNETLLKLPKSKVNTKLLKCSACQIKWQKPYPQPKVSHVTKVYIPTLDEDAYNEIKTESLHKISKMIDRSYVRSREEKKKLINESGGIQSTTSTSASSSSSSNKSRFIAGYSTEVVQLKDIDLALIRQEIKEKEAQRKYTNFFKKPK